MTSRLTTKGKWEDVWADVRLPQIKKGGADLRRQLTTYLPRDASLSLCEVGCAVGGRMAWFYKEFGYCVEGIEYAEVAAEVTKRNLDLQSIPATVHVADFFSDDILTRQYDIVFSAGFIEHFKDLASAVARHCAIASQYVVLMVPNVYGINGLISKTIRPKVYAEHNPIDKPLLWNLCVEAGLTPLFCDYIGGAQLIMPAAHRPFFRRHRVIARVLNLPVRIFNRVSSTTSQLFHITPRYRWCSSSILFIGTKSITCANRTGTHLPHSLT